MFQVPALKRDLEQARINQAYEIGWLCNESLFRWHWNKDFNVPCHETISWWYVNKDFALAMLRSTLLAARDPQIRPAVLRNALLVAQHGAGAKKCWGPAPLIIINILKVRNLSFYGGAGNHKKSAPAPIGNQVSTRSSLSLTLEQGFRRAVPRNALLVAQHGAGAKKDWEPAPLKIINILKVRNLSFSNGASNHENMSLYSSCRWRRFSRRHKKRPPGVVRLSGVPKNGSYLLSQLVGQYHRRW